MVGGLGFIYVSSPRGTTTVSHLFEPMKARMFAFGNYLKVFNAIVVLVTVDMMHMLTRKQQPPYRLFHHEAMFGNFLVARIGMLWHVYPDVSTVGRASAGLLLMKLSHLRDRFWRMFRAFHGIIPQLSRAHLSVRFVRP